jgi:peptidyl-prolyl isomerase D
VPLDSDPPELGQQLNAIKTILYSNSALLQNKVGQYGDAADNATKALETEGIADKDKAKALFRRAQAKVGKKNEEEALEDLEEAKKLAPGDAGIVKELEGIKKKIKDRREKEKKAYKNAFNF